MNNAQVKLETVNVNITSFGLAKMSNGLFNASENYSATDIPLLNFFLYCASIELGLKASILSVDNSKNQKVDLKSKDIGHDLEKIYSRFKFLFPEEELFLPCDVQALQKINRFYRDKGIEYITLPMIMVLMKGMSAFPQLSEIRAVAKKVNLFISGYKLFIGA